MTIDLDEAAYEIRQEGYEEGCDDGYGKAMDDLLDILNDDTLTIKAKLAECKRAAERGSR